MRKVTCCPYCGSTALISGQSAFLEIGEWDGKRHGSEGDAAGWICESCNGEFWVNGPRMVGEPLDAPSDRCCVKCGEVIDAEAEQCPHCIENQAPSPSEDVCRTYGGPGASSDLGLAIRDFLEGQEFVIFSGDADTGTRAEVDFIDVSDSHNPIIRLTNGQAFRIVILAA